MLGDAVDRADLGVGGFELLGGGRLAVGRPSRMPARRAGWTARFAVVLRGFVAGRCGVGSSVVSCFPAFAAFADRGSAVVVVSRGLSPDCGPNARSSISNISALSGSTPSGARIVSSRTAARPPAVSMRTTVCGTGPETSSSTSGRW